MRFEDAHGVVGQTGEEGGGGDAMAIVGLVVRACRIVLVIVSGVLDISGCVLNILSLVAPCSGVSGRRLKLMPAPRNVCYGPWAP